MKCKLGLVIVCALALGCGKSSRGGGDGGGEEDGGGGDGGTSETTTCLLGGANRYARAIAPLTFADSGLQPDSDYQRRRPRHARRREDARTGRSTLAAVAPGPRGPEVTAPS